MSATPEILTLQFGHYANHIGAHWWNLQELSFTYNPAESHPTEIAHDALYRPGLNAHHQPTYTPRLLLVDLKNSLLALPETGDLYPEPPPAPATPHALIRAPPAPKLQYQADLAANRPPQAANLAPEVRVWSDYLYARLHPRTIEIIRQFEHGNAHQPFDSYAQGTELWRSAQFGDDFADKARNYIEECDYFAGFHALFDAIDGFSGLATAAIQSMKEEYGSKCVLAFPTLPYATSIEKGPVQLINYLLTIDSLKEFADLAVPLSIVGPRTFPNVKYDPLSAYESSAVLATALDTFTLPYRLKAGQWRLADVAKDLGGHGRTVAAASLNFPLLFGEKSDFIEYLDAFEGKLSESITPNCEISYDQCVQIYGARLKRDLRLKNARSEMQRKMAAFRCNSTEEMLKYYVDCTCFGSRSHVTTCTHELSAKMPFPKIFGHDFDQFSVLSGLHNGGFVGDMIEKVTDEVSKYKIGRFEQFASIDGDDYRESIERVLELRDCYKSNDYLV